MPGYGADVPKTEWSLLLSIPCVLIGLPFMWLFLIDLGAKWADTLSNSIQRFRWNLARRYPDVVSLQNDTEMLQLPPSIRHLHQNGMDRYNEVAPIIQTYQNGNGGRMLPNGDAPDPRFYSQTSQENSPTARSVWTVEPVEVAMVPEHSARTAKLLNVPADEVNQHHASPWVATIFLVFYPFLGSLIFGYWGNLPFTTSFVLPLTSLILISPPVFFTSFVWRTLFHVYVLIGWVLLIATFLLWHRSWRDIIRNWAHDLSIKHFTKTYPFQMRWKSQSPLRTCLCTTRYSQGLQLMLEFLICESLINSNSNNIRSFVKDVHFFVSLFKRVDVVITVCCCSRDWSKNYYRYKYVNKRVSFMCSGDFKKFSVSRSFSRCSVRFIELFLEWLLRNLKEKRKINKVLLHQIILNWTYFKSWFDCPNERKARTRFRVNYSSNDWKKFKEAYIKLINGWPPMKEILGLCKDRYIAQQAQADLISGFPLPHSPVSLRAKRRAKAIDILRRSTCTFRFFNFLSSRASRANSFQSSSSTAARLRFFCSTLSFFFSFLRSFWAFCCDQDSFFFIGPELAFDVGQTPVSR